MAATRRDPDMTVYPIQAAVRSESDGARSYTVTLPHCPCADFTNRRGQLIPVEADKHVVAVTVCKHIAEALARIGGWHRGTPEPQVYPGLFQAEAKRLLQGPDVALRPRLANSVLREATDSYAGSDFERGDGGALVDGHVDYDKVKSRYTVTLRP